MSEELKKCWRSATTGGVRMLALAGLCLVAGIANAAAIPKTGLPPALEKAAAECRVDPTAVTVSVVALDGLRVAEEGRMPVVKPVLDVNGSRRIAPASTAKLVTTLAGLELLGADWRWETGFYAEEGPNEAGRVKDVFLKGGGDPTLVQEDFGMLVDRLAQLGVTHIDGNLVVDRSLFDVPETDPGAFDGQGMRAYNLLPDAAIVGYRTVFFEFVPDERAGVARIVSLPALAGVTVQKTVPLTKEGCGNWKDKVGYRLKSGGDGRLVAVFDGGYPKACGPKTFILVPLKKNDYLTRIFRAFWERDGRTWTGRVVDGKTPTEAIRLATRTSEALPVVTALVNKWSNNLIARHIFLSLGALHVGKAGETGTNVPLGSGIRPEDAQAVLAAWLAEKGVEAGEVVIENGSGLSRTSRVTARAMTQLLAAGWLSPRMSEYMSSLPVTGVDGTMRKRPQAPGRAHIKTGFLQDVRSIGGYVYAKNGRRYALFASVHGEKNMPGGIKFLDRVIDWTYAQP